MKIQELQVYKKILILGYGQEGRMTEKFLRRFVPDSEILIADKKDGENYLSKQNEANLVIKSPSIRPDIITKPYTTATNIFFANSKNKIIGITGTKGKSTTATLIHLCLLEAGHNSFLIGNIGTAALTQLMTPPDEKDVFVMELSSYQLVDIHYSPFVGVFLNIYPDHSNYHDSLEKYVEAKSNIAKFCQHRDYFIYNPAFFELRTLASHTKAHAIPFEEKIPFSVDNDHLRGKHNEDNVRAVLAVCKGLSIEQKFVERACSDFKGLPHRMESLGEYGGIVFIDDGAATTPQATICALETVVNVDTLFVGGENRAYDFSELARTICKKNITNMVFFPDSGDAILSAIRKGGGVIPYVLQTKSMAEAVQFAYKHTRRGHVCLLSSASPSYSLWTSFNQKGAEFKKYITQYAQTA